MSISFTREECGVILYNLNEAEFEYLSLFNAFGVSGNSVKAKILEAYPTLEQDIREYDDMHKQAAE